MTRETEATPETIETDDAPIRDDLIIGVDNIAKELGVSRRRASYWHENRQLPTFKLCGSVCARRSEMKALLRAKPLPVAEGE